MEENSRTRTLKQWLVDPVFWIGLFAAIYLAVLPMADTIALRNVALVALLVCLSWQFPRIRNDVRLVWPLMLWGAYLLMFPLFASDHAVALKSLSGQWGRGLLAMLAGAGTALILRDRQIGSIFHLGLISSVSILVYWVMATWTGLQTGAIPWGYWGRETHHADLGYAAGQAVVLLAAVLAAGSRRHRCWAVGLIAAALLCTALARSRAGLGFAVFGGALVFFVAFLTHESKRRHHMLAGLLALVLLGAVLVGIAAKVDPRWGRMTSQLSAGLMGDPVRLECEGTSSIEEAIVARYGDSDAQAIIASVRNGDGARVVLLRAGLELALKHPWGLDGSRQSFQKILRLECPTPILDMAHTHNGWVDTLLAIGWAGAALYLWVLVYFLRQGVAGLSGRSCQDPWALVLIALSLFWIVRGFTDSVYRDHMLEMQGYVLAYALIARRRQIGRLRTQSVT